MLMKKQEKIDVLKKIKKEVVNPRIVEAWSGICLAMTWLRSYSQITGEQERWVESKLPKQRYQATGYCWEPGVKAPRIKWINEQIKLLENKK